MKKALSIAAETILVGALIAATYLSPPKKIPADDAFDVVFLGAIKMKEAIRPVIVHILPNGTTAQPKP